MTTAAERKMQFLFALRSKGVTDTRVLTAMERIDRGDFVRGLFSGRAYEDMPLPISCGQTISQPSVVALMTQALNVQPRDKVLEVGTGSGYQAAILSQLARRVYTVERYRRLVRDAQKTFEKLGLTNVTAIAADGSHGLPEQAPFDRIIVGGSCDVVPDHLEDQLAEGGSLILPLGPPGKPQQLTRVTRKDGATTREQLGEIRIAPLVKGRSRQI